MIPLTTFDDSRREFGRPRSVCACEECTLNCKFIPGYLIPADLQRLYQATRSLLESLDDWSLKHLLASPGALVSKGGVTYRIPTLVPARKENGECHWLTEGGRCAIHKDAPFGCAFFDAHQLQQQAAETSAAGLREVARAHQVMSAYAMSWEMLYLLGRVAPSPEESRRNLQRALRERKGGER